MIQSNENMKKILLICFLFSCLPSVAQQDSINIRDVFRQMPDSLMPYLTHNNRLDMIDFMDAGMKAAVTNRLGGETLMTYLSADSLHIQMSLALEVEMKLEKTDTLWTVCVKHTYLTAGRQKEVAVCRYSSFWRPVGQCDVQSTLLRRDDEVANKPHF